MSLSFIEVNIDKIEMGFKARKEGIDAFSFSSSFFKL